MEVMGDMLCGAGQSCSILWGQGNRSSATPTAGTPLVCPLLDLNPLLVSIEYADLSCVLSSIKPATAVMMLSFCCSHSLSFLKTVSLASE